MRRAGFVTAGVLLFALALQAWVNHAKTQPVPRAVDHCTDCHVAVTGIEAGHASLSCAACHLGNAHTKVPALAHVGLIRIPGNLSDADRTCGAWGCHVDVPGRIRGNIMNTMNGVVSVDRWMFGEQPTPTARTPVQQLGHTPADTHLRNLCASCHLGNEKAEAGPLTERSRGGGCNACHLRYSEAARASLHATDPAKPFVHAALSVKPEPIACFGCHARSGRVSLNIDGWTESVRPERSRGAGELRQLEDGRTLSRTLGDVHAERGLGCIDCHGSWEVMGDGTTALHREDQSTLRCTDCHLVSAARTKTFDQLDPESQRIATLEGFTSPERRYLTQQKSGRALINTFASDGGAFLTGKYTARTVAMAPPAAACTQGTAHDALSCGSCHEAWVPQCVSCHTRFDPDEPRFDLLDKTQADGAWLEDGGDSLAEPASLGVRVLDGGARRVEEFAPGMISTLEVRPGDTRFHRLFAPVFAHTVRREARACVDCHANPLALGYGRGTLHLDGGWRFTPAYPARAEDGLPEDAWIGFLSTRGVDSTTREDTRPFTVEEQRRILTVGACLRCHAPGSAPMQAALEDFPAVRRRQTPRCQQD